MSEAANGVEVRIGDAHISVSRGKHPKQWEKEKNPHWDNFKKLLRFMGSIGFYVGKDAEIEKKYPALNDYRRIGRYGDLKFKAEWAENYFSIRFYQDINHENPHGGYYDFRRTEKMPYLIRKQYELTLRKMIDYFESEGYEIKRTDQRLKGAAFIVSHYIEGWHHPQTEPFDLTEIEGQAPDQEYRCMDADKKILRNGDTKYFRDRNGYLCRGKVYHNINNMWWVLLPDNTVKNIAAFALFDLNESICRKREKRHMPPKEYVERKHQLSLCSTKELENELRYRKKLEKELSKY